VSRSRSEWSFSPREYILTTDTWVRDPSLMRDNGERLIPDVIGEGQVVMRGFLELHLERYELACDHADGSRVLDIACGVGYGSRMLADAGASTTVGVDIDNEAVEYARHRYGRDRLSFVVGDADSFNDEPFDLIATFETLEHVPSEDRFLRRLTELLRPSGILLLSGSVGETSDFYFHHRRDYEGREYRDLLSKHGFEIVSELNQKRHFAARDVRSLANTYARLSPVARIARHPFHYARRMWQLGFSSGLTYENLTLVCRRASPDVSGPIDDSGSI
jgi:2-polyprenyl-3-methyl-5-hydroxy-6-metoxy-1,4-benzoquinol methylase